MQLSSATLLKIREALEHYLKYRPAFGRSAIEQLDLDDKHRLEVYNALDELLTLRKRYDDLYPGPNWDEAPKWAEWWAMDENGDGYWYEGKPELGGLIWKQKDYTRYEPDGVRANAQWRATLQPRPPSD